MVIKVLQGYARGATTLAVSTLCFALPAAAQRQALPRDDIVYEASIVDLQRAMTRGSTTSVALVDAYLARVAAYDKQGPALNAVIRLNPSARADAAALDAERRAGRVRGPLHGIPVIVKDNYGTRGMPTSAGTIAFASLEPDERWQLVERGEWIRVPAGKTIVRQGEPGYGFFGIGSGQLAVTRDGRGEATLGPGDHFGEVALLLDVARTATVHALTPVRLFRVDRQAFDELVRTAIARPAGAGPDAMIRIGEH